MTVARTTIALEGSGAEETQRIFDYAMTLRQQPFKSLTSEQAACIVIARTLAQRYFYYFVSYVRPDFKWAPAHVEIAMSFDDIVEGRCRREILSLMPRFGKSLMSSVLLPVYHTAHNEAVKNRTRQTMVATYGTELSWTFSRQCKALMASSDSGFSEIFPDVRLDPNMQSLDLIGTERGSSIAFLGAGGPIVGRGLDLGVVDDPIKNYTAASSMLQSSELFNWFLSAFLTRANSPEAAYIIAATRWSIRDLSGRVLQMNIEGRGEPWKHLHYPAIDQDGNSCDPVRWPVDRLLGIKQEQGPILWQALYIGAPQADGGQIFRPEWFTNVYQEGVDIPRTAKTIIGVDFGLSGRGDKTAIVVVSVVKSNIGRDQFYIRSVYAERLAFDAAVSQLALHFQKWPDAKTLAIEVDGAFYAGSGLITEVFRRALVRPHIVRLSKVGNKIEKSTAWQGACEAGLCWLPSDEPLWLNDFIRTHIGFTGQEGGEDDIVDACANVIRAVHQARIVGRSEYDEYGSNVYELHPKPPFDPTKPFYGQCTLGSPDDDTMLVRSYANDPERI